MRVRLAAALVAVALASCSKPAKRDVCAEAVEQGKWLEVDKVCRGDDRPFAQIAQGMALISQRKLADAIEVADHLSGTVAFIEAISLAGQAEARHGLELESLGRAHLRLALYLRRSLGPRGRASQDIEYLSYLSRDSIESRQLGQLAVREAELTGNKVAEGRARTSLADAYARASLIADAEREFNAAADLLIDAPNWLAFTYLKFGTLKLESELAAQRAIALPMFDEALKLISRLGTEEQDAARTTVYGLRLNRAMALIDSSLLDEAAKEVERARNAANTEDERDKATLVEGYIAAERNDVELARTLFDSIAEHVSSSEYAWQVPTKMGEMYEQTGRLEEAEHYYRTAINAVEAMRRDAPEPQMRTHLLQRRREPYLALLDLLVKQRSDLDALQVAESLYARSWSDAVLGERNDPLIDSRQSQIGIRAREADNAREPLAKNDILARLVQRETLMYVTSGERGWRLHTRGTTVDVVTLDAAQVDVARRFINAPADAALAEQAAAVLIPADIAPGPEPLYIIAGGDLAPLPFAALRRRGRFLVEDRDIARVPGLATLGCRPRNWDRARIFIGDAEDGLHRDLPLAAKEVKDLAGDEALTGDRATVAAVKAAANASLLHIAVHGDVNNAGAGELTFANGEKLTSAEVFVDGIGPREVVLTGCATADSGDNEAWSGFPSAFLGAGSQFVVATLKTVEDAPAAEFVDVYYQQDPALDPVRRLGAAQRHFIAAARAAGIDGFIGDWPTFAVWGDAACR